jgi:hypothetical protein
MILVCLPMALLLLASPAGAARPEHPDDPSTTLSMMFEAAGRHRGEEVLRLKSQVEASGDRTLEIGYPIALYIASPEEHEHDFLDRFPTDAEGIILLYQRIESQGLTPKPLYSFEELGRIACRGSSLALERLFQGAGVAEEAVARCYCESIGRALEAQPEKSLQALGKASKEQWGRVSRCFAGYNPPSLHRMEARLAAMRSGKEIGGSLKETLREVSGWIRLALASPTTQPSGASGIEGIVLIGPVRPSTRVGDPTPNEVPFAAKLQVLSAGDGSEAARVASGEDGKFRIELPPGDYIVRQVRAEGRPYPMGGEATVTVKAGQFSSVTLHFDSGMR